MNIIFTISLVIGIGGIIQYYTAIQDNLFLLIVTAAPLIVGLGGLIIYLLWKIQIVENQIKKLLSKPQMKEYAM